MRRIVLRSLLWAFAALALGLAALPPLLHSERAKHVVKAQIEARFERAVGRGLEVDFLDYTLLPLSLEIQGMRIAGLKPESPPVLEAERLYLEMHLPSWQFGELEIVRLEIDRPRARIEILEVGDNLPRHRRRAQPRRFHVSIDAVEVREGVVELDHQRKLSLSFRARGVEGEALGTGENQLEGRTRMAQVEVILPGAEPIEVRVEGRIGLGPGEVRLAAVRLMGPEISAEARGRVQWKERARSNFQVAAEVGLPLLRRLGYSQADLSGRVSYEGSVGIGSEAWGFRGLLKAEDLRLEGRRIRNLEGVLSGDRKGVRLALERARYAGGALSGRVEVAWTGDRALTQLDLELEGLDLVSLSADSGIALEGIGTRIDGSLSYGFEAAESLRGSGWADFQLRPKTSAEELGLEGELALTLHDGLVATSSIRLQGGGLMIFSSGSYHLATRNGVFTYDITSDDLAPVSRVLARSLDLADRALPLWLPSTGHGKAEGELRLLAGSAETEMLLDLRDVEAIGIRAGRASGSLLLGKDGVERLRMELDRGPERALLVTGHARGSEVAFTVDAVRWPIEDARPWLDFSLPFEGAVTGWLRLEGPPESMEGALSASIDPVRIENHGLGALSVDVQWNSERLELEMAELEMASGQIRAGGTVDLATGDMDLDVEARELDLGSAELSTWVPGLGGRISGKGTLGGQLSEPHVEAKLVAADLTIGDRLLGEGSESSIELTWDGRELHAHGDLPGLLEIDGGGRLDRESADLRFGIRSQELDAFLALALGGRDLPLTGQLEGEIHLVSDLVSDTEIELKLERLSASYQEHRLENLEPVIARWRSGALSIESLYLGTGEDNEVFLSGALGSPDHPELDLHLQARLAAGWLELVDPRLRAEGRFDFLGGIRGSFSRPVLDGLGELVDGRLLIEAFPHAFEEVGGVLLFYPGEIVLDGVEARMAGGSLLLGGKIDLPDGRGESEVSYQLQLRAREISPRWLDGWLLRGDADLALISESQGRRLRGTVRLDRAYYLEDVSVDPIRLLLSLLERQRREVGTTDEMLVSTQLDLAIDVPDTLRVRNNMAELDGRAALTLRGSLARPVVFGRVDLEPGGSLVYSETEYRLDRGALTFNNPYRIEPVIDLVATADVRDYEVTLSLVGTLDRLQPTFSSSPPLPDLEVIRLLLTRQEPRSADLASLEGSEGIGVAATSLLYGQAASLVSDRFSTLFGLDEVRIQPLSTGADDFTSSTAVTVGKQLTGDLYVSYAYDPTSTGERRLRAEWTIGAGKLLVLTQNSDGSYALDLQFENRY